MDISFTLQVMQVRKHYKVLNLHQWMVTLKVKHLQGDLEPLGSILFSFVKCALLESPILGQKDRLLILGFQWLFY